MKYGKEEFYNNKEDNKIIDKLYMKFISAKDVENIIFQTINKMENLKNNHEEIALINLKLRKIINEQEKISKEIIENEEILNKLKENVDSNIQLMKKNLEFLNKKIK